MHSVTTKKAALAALLVLAALLSIFAVGKRASDPAYHQASIDALAEKQETVLELTAASTAASAAITLLPGDTATPIAEKLADLSGYFLIVLCATARGFSPLHHVENIEKRYENANIPLIFFEFFQILYHFFEFCLVTCLVFTESS